jgi:CheY-like chemotaxis protein
MNEPASRKKLLLVEDNTATAARLGKMLTQQAGYQVIVASDCVTALKFLRSFKPDLMLLDERLLTRDGTDLLQRLHLMKDPRIFRFFYLAQIPQGASGSKSLLTDELYERVFQSVGSSFWSASSATGSWIRKRAPSPGRVCTAIVPWWSLMMP